MKDEAFQVLLESHEKDNSENEEHTYNGDDDDDDDDDKKRILTASPTSTSTTENTNTDLNDINSFNNENTDLKLNTQANTKFNYFIDSLLSAFIFAPISALYWYGTWSLLDIYFLPNYQLLSSILCFLIGLVILLPGYIFQEKIQNLYNKRNFIVQFFIRFIYAYVISFACVLEWKGCWSLLDRFVVLDWKGQLSLAIIAIAYMLMARSFRLVMTAPFSLQYDTYDDYFLSRSRYSFHFSQHSTYIQYCIDFIIVEIIELFATIIAWRNLSIVFDVFISPNNLFNDIIISLIIGYFIYFLLAYTQHYICRFCSKLTLIPHLFIEDTFNLLMLISLTLLWRAYWVIPDKYFFTKDYKIEVYCATHFISFIMSIILNASIVITGSGYEFKDGEISEDGDFFQLKYVSAIIEERRRRSFEESKNRRLTVNVE